MGPNSRTTITGIATALIFLATGIGALSDMPKWILVIGLVCGAVAKGLNAVAQADAQREPPVKAPTEEPKTPKVPPVISAMVAAFVAYCVALSGCLPNGKLDPRVPQGALAVTQIACALAPIFVHGDQAVGIACVDVAPAVTKILQAFATAPYRATYTTVMPPCKLAPIAVGDKGVGFVCETYAQEVTQRLTEGSKPTESAK